MDAFDVLDLISSAWYGKQYYFLQDDGTVYSRESCKPMAFEDALNEFCDRISLD